MQAFTSDPIAPAEQGKIHPVIIRDGEFHISPLVHQVDAAARRLGVSRRTFYLMVKDGRLRTFKIAGRVVVAESELQRVVAEAMREAA
ncbi:helix-turn-helix domain-containing protein [Rhodanobacter sp. B2A1Ga4]|uniref:helix-turn-helix domain-containing protein n=1 Tax=Rhodanobacter TaxID=75309 RepID=UPI000D39CC68|nr:MULTISPECIES: helix-turn-helix domain-containing protein [Rhodanobacter]MBQ4853219.1 helix-turn-helix domain-containing protein [Rhodanobacter sp. B2A1Ga4]